MGEATTKPTKGFTSLLDALETSVKDTGSWAGVRGFVPGILKLLPKAMQGLSVEDPRPVVAACKVIEYLVKAQVDNAGENPAPSLDAECLKQCQGILIVWLKKAAAKAAVQFDEESKEDTVASKEVKAVAHATASLFRLNPHASACKQEWKWDGIKTALSAMDNFGSGIKREAHQALVEMLNAFLENSIENIEGFITNSGTSRLIPYVEDPEKYDVPSDMLVHCFAVLEACVESGKSFKNLGDVKLALEKSRPAVQKIRGSEKFLERQISESECSTIFGSSLSQQSSQNSQ